MNRPIFLISLRSMYASGTEVLDFAGDPAAEAGGIKERDQADAGFALEQSLPGVFCPHTHGAHQTHPGHYYATLLDIHLDEGALVLVPSAQVSPFSPFLQGFHLYPYPITVREDTFESLRTRDGRALAR